MPGELVVASSAWTLNIVSICDIVPTFQLWWLLRHRKVLCCAGATIYSSIAVENAEERCAINSDARGDHGRIRSHAFPYWHHFYFRKCSIQSRCSDSVSSKYLCSDSDDSKRLCSDSDVSNRLSSVSDFSKRLRQGSMTCARTAACGRARVG